MSEQIHPALLEAQQAAAAEGEPAPEGELVSTEAPAADAQGAPPEEDDSRFYVRIDTRRLPDEISRLEQELPDFKRNFRARGGRLAEEIAQEKTQLALEAKEREHQARIAELQAEREHSDWQMRAGLLTRLQRDNPQELQRRITTNPQAAQDWARLQNGQTPEPPEAVRERNIAQREVFAVIDEMQSKGMPAAWRQEILRDVANGAFNAEDIPSAIRKMRAYLETQVNLHLLQQAQQAVAGIMPPPPPAAVQPQAQAAPVAAAHAPAASPIPMREPVRPNAALSRPGPDTSGGQLATGAVSAMKKSEFNSQNPEQQLKTLQRLSGESRVGGRTLMDLIASGRIQDDT